ncbi:MAG: hypothetical protein KHX03_05025 [Clostridium sp.]|nr:hypothetical protein [Clostridium sp.]
MKKLMSTLLIFLCLSETVLAIPVDTTGWACNPEHISVNASEIQLKSDLKNDFRVYQTTISNLTKNTVDVSIPVNNSFMENVNKLLNSGLSFKELMTIPKQIAVDSYNEDVGTGNIAKAHKGLIYILASAGAVIAGAGLIGVYPQQKTEEFFSKRKVRKEYSKINKNIIDSLVLSPLEEKDVYLFMPIENNACVINSSIREEEQELNSDYHQL